MGASHVKFLKFVCVYLCAEMSAKLLPEKMLVLNTGMGFLQEVVRKTSQAFLLGVCQHFWEDIDQTQAADCYGMQF